MSGQARLLSIMGFLLLISLVTAGCMEIGIGDAVYQDHAVRVGITNAGEPTNVTVQVTIYRIRDLRQEMDTIAMTPALLPNGGTTVSVPVELGPGDYKLYIYILRDGDRKTAVIRDITV